jgi:glucose-6-phosphate 1-dehydrogenase
MYLALPAGLFPAAISAFGGSALPPGSRVVVEKPFGVDLQSAIHLNRLLGRLSGSASEPTVYRVDHVLAMSTVQNLIALRFSNRVFQTIWSREHVEQVEILWEETLGLEGRAGYYDHVGALKDVMQNHMVQLLALVAMEGAEDLGELAMQNRRVELLRSVRPLTMEAVAERTRRGRYAQGTLQSDAGAGRPVPAYAQELGVDPHRNTETFAEVALEIDTPRWNGTRFLLRAGKALARRRKEVILHFRPVGGSDPNQLRNHLRIGIDGPEEVVLQLVGRSAGPTPRMTELSMIMPPPPSDLPAYGAILIDMLSERSTFSVSGDEAEEAWRVFMPVIEGWRQGIVPLEEYPAGSRGLHHRFESP